MGGRGGRTHAWVFGLAALFVAINKALADADDTPQRAAARSTVALAMTKCVCMGYPLFGEIAHLGAALEQSLRLSKFKYIDDAFLLACVLFEGATVQFEP